jgi:alpha-tubulin suppressor-like RCC1 family protein
LYAWGDNSSPKLGRLGIPTTGRNYTRNPLIVNTSTDWNRVSAGSNNSLAIKNNGTLWAWGANGRGQLGLGDTTTRSSPVQVGTDTTWSEVSTGASSDSGIYAPLGGDIAPVTQAIKTNGTLWTWGTFTGPSPQSLNYSSPVQVGALTTWIALGQGGARGAGHGIISTNNTLYAWGYTGNDLGGRVLDGNYACPLCIPYASSATGSWFNSSPKLISTNVSTVRSGGKHALYISTAGSLWAWGSNTVGQCAQGPNNPLYYVAVDTSDFGICAYPQDPITGTSYSRFSSSPVSHVGFTVYAEDETCIAANAGDIGTGTVSANTQMWGYSTPIQIGSGTDWSDISAGGAHSMAIKNNGTLWAWGYNFYGQLGIGDYANRSSPVQIGSLNTWAKVHCGHTYTIAIKNDGTLWAWGTNDAGELGLGISLSVAPTSPVQIGSKTTWLSTGISTGGNHVLAILS